MGSQQFALASGARFAPVAVQPAHTPSLGGTVPRYAGKVATTCGLSKALFEVGEGWPPLEAKT